MIQINSQLTLQEFLELSLEEGDITYELIDGQAIPKMSPKKFHSKLTRALLYLIDEWSQGRGEVCPELAVKLTKQEKDWVPVPELLYISAERFPEDWQEDVVCSIPPDLVIEIISPGQTFGQLMVKAINYLEAGVLRVLVVDSKARSITVFYPETLPQTYMGDIQIRDSLFEGLELTVEQVFNRAGIPTKIR